MAVSLTSTEAPRGRADRIGHHGSLARQPASAGLLPDCSRNITRGTAAGAGHCGRWASAPQVGHRLGNNRDRTSPFGPAPDNAPGLLVSGLAGAEPSTRITIGRGGGIHTPRQFARRLGDSPPTPAVDERRALELSQPRTLLPSVRAESRRNGHHRLSDVLNPLLVKISQPPSEKLNGKQSAARRNNRR